MNQDSSNRLSRLSTSWTLVEQARGGPEEAEAAAQAALLERYQEAIYRHLLRGTRSPTAADELFQEFALRFLRGDFRRAEETRGRFRDYVRAALNNLISTHRAREARKAKQAHLQQAEEVPEEAAPADLDQEFLTSWRQGLLDRAWQGLAALEQPGSPPYYTALRLRYEKPDCNSGELAKALTGQGQAYTEAGLRKLVQRARELFTDLLLDEIARSLGTSDVEELEREVIDLGFQAYCKRALERRRGAV